MRKYLDMFSWIFVAAFATPTLLIMSSWGSLPGDFMYPVKIGLEQSLLFASKPSYSAEASLNVKYTERRFNEAKILLANDQSGKGLGYLSQQVVATQTVIQHAPSPVVKRQLASQYISQLKQVSSELETQKQTMKTPSSSGSSQPNTSVVNQIDNTQNQINDTINNLETVSTEDTAEPTPTIAPTTVPLTPTMKPKPTKKHENNGNGGGNGDGNGDD